jgi:hypothetical protein
LIDAQGHIRHQHFGEGAYQETEQMIQTLLQEAHQNLAFNTELVQVAGTGATAAAANIHKSPETYLGYARQENLSSPEKIIQDKPARYSAPHQLELDQWALRGIWQLSKESASATNAGDAISYHFQGRDLHLVLGTLNAKPVRFRVTLDGKAPGNHHGTDIDAGGYGEILEHRLYQLIRQNGNIKDHIFRIEFLDTGAEAFAFTFG